MSENKESGGKLTLGKPGRLELQKTVDSGQVRQSFSHGRTKTVKVEKKRKRTFERNESGRMERVGADGTLKGGGIDPHALDGLSPAERDRRLKALEGAAKVEEDGRGGGRDRAVARDCPAPGLGRRCPARQAGCRGDALQA